VNLRKIIQDEASRQGLSGYRIAQLSGVPMRTVQAYLSGASDLSGGRLEKIMNALGLEVRATKRRNAKGGK
jgi:transcriptional regulator with XRE-family HTH domain